MIGNLVLAAEVGQGISESLAIRSIMLANAMLYGADAKRICFHGYTRQGKATYETHASPTIILGQD